MGNTFWERFVYACKQKNTTPTGVVRELGLSTGSPTSWKRGAEPEMSTIALLASHLNVSMAFLSGYEESEQNKSNRTNPISQEELKFALFGSEEIDDSKLNEVIRYAEYIKDK